MNRPDPIAVSLQAYFARNPHERQRFDWLDDAMLDGEHLFDRNSFPHHWTASAWILEPTRKEALVLYHRKLEKWIQPGGHADLDTDLARVALREAREETGLASLRLDSHDIFDFDLTPIRAHKDIPAHNHLDVRFLCWADRQDVIRESSESAGVRWVALAELDALCADEGISRMAAKSARGAFPGGAG